MYIQTLSTADSAPVIVGDNLESFVNLFNTPATIREVKTRKYKLVNVADAARFGLKPEEEIGLTVNDIAKIAKLPDAIVEKIIQEDQSIATGNLPNSLRKMHFLLQSGFVSIEQSFKKPVLDSQGRIVAILGYSYDITSHCSPVDLFALYEKYYPTKEAIQKFLKYFEFDSLFYKMPAKRELLTLLTMRENTGSRFVANSLQISDRTVEEYKARLRTKLKAVSLDEIIIKLVKHHESTPLR